MRILSLSRWRLKMKGTIKHEIEEDIRDKNSDDVEINTIDILERKT